MQFYSEKESCKYCFIAFLYLQTTLLLFLNNSNSITYLGCILSQNRFAARGLCCKATMLQLKFSQY